MPTAFPFLYVSFLKYFVNVVQEIHIRIKISAIELNKASQLLILFVCRFSSQYWATLIKIGGFAVQVLQLSCVHI